MMTVGTTVMRNCVPTPAPLVSSSVSLAGVSLNTGPVMATTTVVTSAMKM